MSITNFISPSGEPSCQDALWHIATSDNSGQTDMKYVFDVYNGTTQLVRVKIYPQPTNGRGFFDASRVVKNEITYDWFVPSNTGSTASYLYNPSSGEIFITYNVRVGEDVSGVTTLNMASGNTTAYNWIAPMLKRRQQDTTIFANKFLTNRPLTAKLGFTERFLIGMKRNGNLTMKVKAYDESKELIGEGNSSVATSMNGYVQLDLGVSAVNATIGSTEITSVASYYDISFVETTQTFRLYLTCDTRYTPMNLYFMNHYGVFDTARFGLSNNKSMTIERKTFQRKEYDLNTGSVSYYDAKNVYNESKINYNSKSNWSYKLTMDFPTDAEYEWLSELIDSPQIFAEIDNNYYPVTLKSTTYEYVTHQNDGFSKPFQIDIDINQPRFGFRR